MVGILKRYIFVTTLSITGTLMSGTVAAQTNLQGASGGIQQQTQQTQQQSGSGLNQTGSLQNNNGTALNQSSMRPLSVVSSPGQTTPDATVQPSRTLTADINTSSDSTNPLVYIAIGSAILVVIGVYVLQRTSRPLPVQPEEKPVIKPEPIKVTKKTRKPRKNKKKKSSR